MKNSWALTMFLVLVLWLTSMGSAFAQFPFVPREFYKGARRLQGERIVFCTWQYASTKAIDRLIAAEIAEALLLEVEFHEILSRKHVVNEEFQELLWVALEDHCDAALGFNLSVETLPDWLTVSRSYYRAPYILIVTNQRYHRLADLPRDRFIGSQLYTLADFQFAMYLQSLPAERRWRRLPYMDADMLVRHLTNGDIEAALIWAPALHGRLEANQYFEIVADPLPRLEAEVGLVMRSGDIWLRNMLDEAIGALIDDGIIDLLLSEHGLPGQAGSTRR